MKFDDLFPNQPTDVLQKDILFEGSNLFKYGEPKPCWNCKELTSWIDMNFEANLCSVECFNQKWNEFIRDASQ